MDADVGDGDEAIKGKIAEAKEWLEGLESGKLHIGAPFEGRTEARVFALKRDIAMWQSILDRRNSPAQRLPKSAESPLQSDRHK